MHYLSTTWLLWMWLTVSLYWIAPPAWRLSLLATLTLIFLCTISPTSAALLVAFCGLSHLFGNLLRPTTTGIAAATAIMVGVLFNFKWKQTVDGELLVETLVIPLGLSYYTFRCIHFLIERYKGHIDRATLRELVGYLFFLPTIVVGPIHRFDDYRRDLIRQRFDPALISEGAERILYGYAKIVILGNYLTQGVMGRAIEGVGHPDGALTTYLLTVQTGLNLYFQFSGFSDVAIGFARLLGFRVIENFNWPYLQTNIAAFWRSWHISLSHWCREYIYAPVVAKSRSPFLGAMATMIIIGLWHEISLRFLLWGAYHGIGIAVWQKLQGRTPVLVPIEEGGIARLALDGVKVLATVHFVWFGFIILTADSVPAVIDTFARLLTLG